MNASPAPSVSHSDTANSDTANSDTAISQGATHRQLKPVQVVRLRLAPQPVHLLMNLQMVHLIPIAVMRKIML